MYVVLLRRDRRGSSLVAEIHATRVTPILATSFSAGHPESRASKDTRKKLPYSTCRHALVRIRMNREVIVGAFTADHF